VSVVALNHKRPTIRVLKINVPSTRSQYSSGTSV